MDKRAVSGGDSGHLGGAPGSPLLDSIVENIPNMIFLKDARDLRFLLFNRAGEELLGYAREDLLGKSDYDFFPPEQAEFFTAKDREVLAARTLVEIQEEPIHTRLHGTRILRTKKLPILDERDEPLYLLGISEDITDFKKLEGERERSEAVRKSTLESIPDGILVVSAGGDVVEANRAAVPLLGARSKAELLRPVQEVFSRSGLRQLEITQPSTWTDLRRQVATRGQLSYEARIRRSGGAVLDVLISASLLDAADRQPLVLLVIRNVSSQKKFESLRDEFLSIAAHELKTPLTTIKGYAELLRSWPPEVLARRGGRGLEVIDRQCGRLNRLVQELLEFSRLQLGRMKLRRGSADLGELVAQIVSEMRHTTREHEITLEQSEPVRAFMDRERIEQVIANLLANAIRFSPGGGEIHVSLATRAAEAVVTIRDSGLGIPSHRQSQVFERYFQAHEGTRYAMTAGLGMGLYIAKEIVRRHGGEIGFESTEGKGSTFFFTVPLEGHEPKEDEGDREKPARPDRR